MSTADGGNTVLQSAWLGASGIADPERHLYDAFGVERGGMAQMLGPAVVACGIRATLKGNLIGRKDGDPWTLPTFVLVDGDRVLWRHDGRHAGDHPNWSEIRQRVAS
jgi:hypothetical protein